MQFGALTLPLGNANEPFRTAIAPSVADDPCEDLDEVMDEVEAGKAVAWVATDGLRIVGAVVTQVVEGRKGRQCFIRHCAGADIKQWVQFLDVIKQWARHENCKTIELIGRKGWQKMLPDFEEKAVVLRSNL